MPTYRATDPSSGRTVKLTGDSPPTEQELEQVFSSIGGAVPRGTSTPNIFDKIVGMAKNLAPTAAETTGMLAGGAYGASTGPLGALLGAGLGYAGARQGVSAIKGFTGSAPQTTLPQAAKQAALDTATGASMEAGGQVAGKGLSALVGLLGRGIKQTLGATTGMGPGATEEAIKSGEKASYRTIRQVINGDQKIETPFVKAMRGKTSGEDIVQGAKDALQQIVDKRGAEYQAKLAKLSSDEAPAAYASVSGPVLATKSTQVLDITPVRSELTKKLYAHGATVGKDGTLNLTRTSFSNAEKTQVKEIVDTIQNWGKQKGDMTPIRIDMLKKKLDGFVKWDSPMSSQVKALVTPIRNEVKNVLVKGVPEYAEMTKGYSEATKIIQDIQAGLSIKPSGLNGRTTADQTLRKLTSSMREGFELRKDLVDVLSESAGKDLAGQIAGYSASQIIPRGLIGKLSAGSAGMLAYVNPKFWPVLAASSPRMVGEFLNAYGKAYSKINGLAPAAYKALGYAGGKILEENGIKIPRPKEGLEIEKLGELASEETLRN
jgi:hypothetical protein